MPIQNVVPEITPSVRGKHRIVMMSPAHQNTTTTNNNNNNNNNRNNTIVIITNSNTSNCRTNNKYNSNSSSNNNNNDINNNIINNDDNDNNNTSNNNNNKICITNKNIDIKTTSVKNSIDNINKNHSTDNNSSINNINKYKNDITNHNINMNRKADYSPGHDIIWHQSFSKNCIQTSESPVNEHNKSKMNQPLEGMIHNFECCLSCTNCGTLEGTLAYLTDSNNNQQHKHQQRQQLQQPQQQQQLQQHNLTRIECLKRLQPPRNTIIVNIINNNDDDDDDNALFEHLDQSNDCDALESDKDSSSFLQQHKEKIYQNYCEKLGGEEKTFRRCRGSKAVINGLYFKWLLALVVAVSSLFPTAAASCTRGVTELWAYSNPGSEEFSDSYTRYITSSKGAICRWRVISSKKDWIVQLKFDPFQLKHTTGDKKGDCLEIYNGDNDNAPLMDELCDKDPKVYKSKGRHLFVVYRRGKVPGERRIGFEYQALDTDSNENLIRIAGIIGGCLAGIGLVYLIIRYTQCCGCFGKKEGDGTNSGHANRRHTSNSQERDRLTIQVMDDGEGGVGGISSSGATRITTPGNRPPLTSTTTTTANGSSNVLNSNGHDSTTATTATNNSHGTGLNRRGLSSSNDNIDFNSSNDNTVAGAEGGSGSIGGDEEDIGEESDSGSLHTLNEPPPSYESLYLNEDGETEPPPEYTPPRHKAKNPPRRVHTFN